MKKQNENFDELSPSDINEIEDARERISKGEYTAFSSKEEMLLHFDL